MSSTLLALSPLLVSVVAIALIRQSALRAGVLGTLCTIAIILTVPAFHIDLATALQSVSTGIYNTLNIALVLLGGVALYRVLEVSGALKQISDMIIATVAEPVHRLLALVFGASVFFESATGFGVGIVVVAPLYMALGFAPVQSAVLALLGQCAVPWGALAIGTVLGAEISGVSEVRLGALSAVFGLPVIALFGFAALKVAGMLSKRSVVLLILYALLLSVLLWVSTVFVGAELAGCLAGVCVIGVALTVTSTTDNKLELPWKPLIPFAILMLLLIVTRLSVTAGNAAKHWTVPLFGGYEFAPLYHAGVILLIAAMVGIALFPVSRNNLPALAAVVIKQWTLASVAVGSFILFGQLMLDADMTGQIARAASSFSPQQYLFLVPVIGALGGFLTASNAASNAIFMALQTTAAAELNLPVDVVAASQNASGSNVTLASPGRLIFAATVTGEAGAEATLLRKIAPVTLCGVLSAVVLTYLIG